VTLRRLVTLLASSAIVLTTLSMPAAAGRSVDPSSPTDLTLRLARSPAVLLADGGIRVNYRASCPEGLTAFELDLTVVQGEAYGSRIRRERGVIPCDGVMRRYKRVVHPTVGVFAVGSAHIDGFLSANDGQHGDTDVYAEADVAVREAGALAVAWIARTERPVAADGSVQIRVWLRCRPGQQYFEIDLGVTQGDTRGSVSGPPPDFTCDNTRHDAVIRIHPEGSGAFVPGQAQADLFVGIFDDEEGDLDLTDQASLTLV